MESSHMNTYYESMPELNSNCAFFWFFDGTGRNKSFSDEDVFELYQLCERDGHPCGDRTAEGFSNGCYDIAFFLSIGESSDSPERAKNYARIARALSSIRDVSDIQDLLNLRREVAGRDEWGEPLIGGEKLIELRRFTSEHDLWFLGRDATGENSVLAQDLPMDIRIELLKSSLHDSLKRNLLAQVEKGALSPVVMQAMFPDEDMPTEDDSS